MKRNIVIICMFLSVFLITACQSRLDVSTTLEKVSGKTYVLTAPYKDYGITLSIHGNKINGFAGINNYSGKIEVKDNNIIISDIARTRMTGQDSVMKIEEDFIKNLEASSKITLFNNELRIGNMKFSEKK